MSEIDLVVPYVDSSDKNWQELFAQYNPIKEKEVESINAKNRFRGEGNFFRFFFRCVEKNMPWINNVFLLVQSESQVPEWLDTTKVKVILHEEFIPKEYLPTFNSCTIEMFLWNIPGLSSHFIYANDDVFPLKPLKVRDFFDYSKVKENFLYRSAPGMFGQHCQNCFDLIFKGARKFTCADHELKPYITSAIKRCYFENKKKIDKSITQFRNSKNYNCFIYSLYQLQMNLVQRAEIKSCYTSTYSLRLLTYADVLCINDTSNLNNVYENIELKKWFTERFPKKCKYELTINSEINENQY